MPLKYMETPEMLDVSDSWITTGTVANGVFIARPLTAPIVAELGRAHQLLVEMAVPRNSLVAPIITEQGAVDNRHDALVRAIAMRLEAEAHLTLDPNLRYRLLALRDAFFPDGMTLINRSYRYESGHANIVAQLLGTPERELLATLVTTDGTLLDAVEEYLVVAARLGVLVENRARLDDDRSPGGGKHQETRNLWIRIMTMMRMAQDTIGPEDEDLAEVMQTLDRAEADATRRFVLRQSRRAEVEAEAGAEVEAEAGAEIE